MQRAVLKGEVEAFEARFKTQSGIAIRFDEAACDALIDRSADSDVSIRALCESLFKDLEHGLKIVSGRSGLENFTLGREFVDKPDEALSKLIVESFGRTGVPSEGQGGTAGA
jgi:hypothetical protein